jgi:3-oxoacyl-[acyl-carrier-protein] synthase II
VVSPAVADPRAPVVTGMGWRTPLGAGLGGVWDRLCAGGSGVAPVPSPHRLRTELAALVPDVGYGEEPGRRLDAIAADALTAACADAGLTPSDERVVPVLGTSFADLLDTTGTEPGAGWAGRLAAVTGLARPPVTVATACSAGADSLAVAAALIRSGRATICVAGGADIVTEAKRLGHSALGTMSSTGLAAFDRGHDGMVLGEGAAFLVLEAAGSARERGVQVHAVLRGTGSANDAAGLTAPDPSGASVTAAIDRCLAGSGVDRAEIAAVSAHGTGTPLNDAVEATSLARAFAGVSPGPVVFGTKGALGHSLGATGAIEAVSVVLALQHKRVPPIARTGEPMAELPLRLPLGEAAEISGRAGLSLTLGFGGFNTCLLFTMD